MSILEQCVAGWKGRSLVCRGIVIFRTNGGAIRPVEHLPGQAVIALPLMGMVRNSYPYPEHTESHLHCGL